MMTTNFTDRKQINLLLQVTGQNERQHQKNQEFWNTTFSVFYIMPWIKKKMIIAKREQERKKYKANISWGKWRWFQNIDETRAMDNNCKTHGALAPPKQMQKSC